MFHVKHVDPCGRMGHSGASVEPVVAEAVAAVFGSRVGVVKRYAEVLATTGFGGCFT